jgi:hypothetical protein
VIVTRPGTSFTHIWPRDPRTPPIPTDTIGIIGRYEAWDPSYHAVGVKLLTGPTFSIEVAPSSYTDVIKPGGALERTYLFSLAAPVAAYKVRTDGSTKTALDTFLGCFIKDYVQ